MTAARPVAVAAALLACTLAGWIIAVGRMRGMSAGPGVGLGGLGWYLGVWVTMTAAMMLPAAAPTVLLAARLYHHVELFVLGYLIVWTAYGLAAYGLYRGVGGMAPAFLRWDAGGPYVAGAAVGAAGLYQLTPLKSACLRHCRSPLHFLVRRARKGRIGALAMGTEHGAYCVGCCAGLMLALFALGVMSVFWMAVAAAVIFAEKLAPGGERVARATAVALVGLGIWIASSPSTAPGLTQPHAMRTR